MKNNLLFLFIFLGPFLSAQTFIEATDVPFVPVLSSASAFSDVDGDGDPDLLITGRDSVPDSVNPVTKLYINDGAGNFTESATAISNTHTGGFAFADVDVDGDPDVLVTGIDESINLIAKLYNNDGTGTFSEMATTPFEGVFSGSVAFADVDGDDDPDLLITGANVSNDRIAKLYTNNDDIGLFVEADAPFAGVGLGTSIAFLDIDGNNNIDVIITGRNTLGNPSSTLYTNDGSGNFTEITGTPFEGVVSSSIASADVNGDGHPDVLITGRNTLDVQIAKLYLNDETGNFTEVTNTPFAGVYRGSIAFSDVDGDGNPDVLITGRNNSEVPIANLYLNDGSGNFTEVIDTPFTGVDIGSISTSDVDGDGDSDILITGRNNSEFPITKLYLNQSTISSNKNLDGEFNFDFSLYPNPTKSNEAKVRYISKENALLNVKIFDLEGRLLQQQQEPVNIGEIVFFVNISSLNKGSYILQLNDGVRQGSRMFLIQ